MDFDNLTYPKPQKPSHLSVDKVRELADKVNDRKLQYVFDIIRDTASLGAYWVKIELPTRLTASEFHRIESLGYKAAVIHSAALHSTGYTYGFSWGHTS